MLVNFVSSILWTVLKNGLVTFIKATSQKKGQKHKCWETIKNTNPINIIKKNLPDQIFCGFFKQLAFYGKNIHNMDQTMTIGHKA